MAIDYGSFSWPVGSGGGGGGGGSGMVLASGLENIGSGADHIDVLYDVTLTTAIPPQISFIDTTDGHPIFLQGVVTVTFNTPTDSANYAIEYTVSGNT